MPYHTYSLVPFKASPTGCPPHYLILFLIAVCTAPLLNAQQDKPSWESLQLPELKNPIHKAEELEGTLWASDYGSGIVFRSTDKGDTWQKLAQLQSEYIEKIQFLTRQQGFLCGDYGYVYKTENGGDTWEDISPALPQRITEHYRSDTTRTNRPDGLFIAYYDMHFIDAATGYVSGYTYNPADTTRTSFDRIFMETSDGGAQWRRVPWDSSSLVIPNYEKHVVKENSTFNNTFFPSAEVGWKLGKGKAREDLILRTDYTTMRTDTTVLTKTPFKRVLLRKLLFVDGEQGYVFGGALDQGGQQAVIYRSLDGGKSWHYLPKNWPHIHEAVFNDTYLWLFGKEGFIRRIPLSGLPNGF